MGDKKNKIIVLSGVNIDQTPIISYFIKHYSKIYLVEKIEYAHKKRIKFLFTALRSLLFNISADLVFVGYQLYPLLLIFSIIKKNIIFWALESYIGDEDDSLIAKIIYLEKLIRWQNVRIVIPIEERKIFYDKHKAKSITIIPNVPLKGIIFNSRNFDKKCIRLVMYGNLDNNNVYIREWIEFVKNRSYLDLTLIGRNFNSDISEIRNVRYIGSLNHTDLVEELKNYNFSIIGYRPINFNNKFCSPNKYYESLSLSLPVIVNKSNPTLEKLNEIYKCGISLDFLNISENSFILLSIADYNQMVLNAYHSYNCFLNFELFVERLNFIL